MQNSNKHLLAISVFTLLSFHLTGCSHLNATNIEDSQEPSTITTELHSEFESELVTELDSEFETNFETEFTTEPLATENSSELLFEAPVISSENKVEDSANKKPADKNDSSNDKNNGATDNKNDGSDTVYDPADTNKDGVVDAEEEHEHINEYEQACINAGYGVVVSFDGGTKYMVLTHADLCVNGVTGGDILRNYLAERDLEGHIFGYSSYSENDWYWFMATDIRELITEEDEEFWH